MKNRVLTGLIGGAIVIGFLCGMFTFLLPVMVALIAGIGLFELQGAVGLKNIPLRVLTIAVAAFIPFWSAYSLRIPVYIAAACYVIAALVIMVVCHKSVSFAALFPTLFFSVVFPMAFTPMIWLRDLYIQRASFTKAIGVFLVLFGFFSAWATDIFALLIGRKIGEHKLAPNLSPKKTVEGAIGGLVGAVVFDILLFIVFRRF
nr:phosphatidate cytidylyltransferase [Clostridia bacterium]